MSRKSQKLEVLVSELEPNEQAKVFSINIVVRRELIETSDVIAREGGIERLEEWLERGVREAVSSYKDTGRDFLRQAIQIRSVKGQQSEKA